MFDYFLSNLWYSTNFGMFLDFRLSMWLYSFCRIDFHNVFKQLCPISMTYNSLDTTHILIATPLRLEKIQIACIKLIDNPIFKTKWEFLYQLMPISKFGRLQSYLQNIERVNSRFKKAFQKATQFQNLIPKVRDKFQPTMFSQPKLFYSFKNHPPNIQWVTCKEEA